MARHSIFLVLATCVASASSLTSSSQQCSWSPFSRLQLSQPACPPLVDDRTAAESVSWAPWAYAPHCVYPPDHNVTARHCIYTYLTANGEGGMSLVADPETAAFVAGIFAARSEPWGEAPLWQLSPGEHARAYEIADIPGKERGVVAKRPIRTGEVIMRETPFVVGFTSGPKGIAREENPWLLKAAFERLPEAHTERLGDVAVSTGGEWHEDAMRTNAFGITVDGVDFSALFPEIARLNHACRPNAFTRYSRTTLQMEIVAQQDIEPGEEITITYIPQNLYTADRQKMLSRRGFTCTCPVCSSPSATAASDANKARVQSILETLRDLGPRRTEGVLDELWAEMLGVLEVEALWSQVAEFAALWADLYWLAGAREKARSMAARALRERVFYTGPDSERAEKARLFVGKFGGAS